MHYFGEFKNKLLEVKYRFDIKSILNKICNTAWNLSYIFETFKKLFVYIFGSTAYMLSRVYYTVRNS